MFCLFFVEEKQPSHVSIGHMLKLPVQVIRSIRSKQGNDTDAFAIDKHVVAAKLKIYVLGEQRIHIERTIRHLLSIFPHRKRKREYIHDLLIFQQPCSCEILEVSQKAMYLLVKIVYTSRSHNTGTQCVFNAAIRLKRIPTDDKVVLRL